MKSTNKKRATAFGVTVAVVASAVVGGVMVAAPSAAAAPIFETQEQKIERVEADKAIAQDLHSQNLEEIAEVSQIQADARAEEAAKKAAAEAEERLENAIDDPKAVAADIAAAQYGWGSDQMACLDSLWTKESNWDYQAQNPSSGAYGIPQALPGDKMASAGDDWATNPVTQIEWGLQYIADVYGSPCNAWGHSQATGWY